MSWNPSLTLQERWWFKHQNKDLYIPPILRYHGDLFFMLVCNVPSSSPLLFSSAHLHLKLRCYWLSRQERLFFLFSICSSSIVVLPSSCVCVCTRVCVFRECLSSGTPHTLPVWVESLSRKWTHLSDCTSWFYLWTTVFSACLHLQLPVVQTVFLHSESGLTSNTWTMENLWMKSWPLWERDTHTHTSCYVFLQVLAFW